MTVRSPVWHPFTQHALQPTMTPVASAQGATLTTSDGRQIFDAISSWWVVTHGHCHPKIVAAIATQAATLDQVIFAGHTHAPAENLARRLLRLVPPGLEHVFFSDSGSTAVEVALKMALGFWKHGGRDRTRIVVMEHGYHGDTIGAMSVGEPSVLNRVYEPLLFEAARIPFPEPGRERASVEAFEALCRGGDVAALLVEPLVLGAGGMRSYRPEVLADLAKVCAAHGVLLIADEVMTGWGRTGTLFACEQAGVTPDILCTSKGLTGGSLPLAATLCRGDIFDAHYSTDRARTFYHSSSYTANPIACAAANANLDIWETEPVTARITALSAMQAERLSALRDHPNLADVRGLGTIAAVDLKVSDGGYLAQAWLDLYTFFAERDLLVRPLGATIYVMPPYCTTSAELDRVFDAIAKAAERFGR